MRIYLENEGDLELDLNYQEVAQRVGDAVLDYEQCPYESEVELLLTMDEEIREMNREFRDIDRATDVLSFPMIAYESPADFAFLEEDESCFDPDTGELMLGNIVISKQKVVEQAEEYGHTVEREYAFLIAHSMLHLLGYDHMEEEERAVMEKKQREILDGLGIPPRKRFCGGGQQRGKYRLHLLPAVTAEAAVISSIKKQSILNKQQKQMEKK